MSWDKRGLRSVGTHIAVRAGLTFGALFALAGALVLGMTIRHHVDEYHESLMRLVGDLTGEYAESQGDVAKMRAYFTEDAEEHGAHNVFLLIARPDGRPVVSYSSHEKTIAYMRELAVHPSRLSRTHRFVSAWKNGGKLVVRVRQTVLPDGKRLLVGWNVTDDERLIVRLAVLLGTTFVLFLLAGAFLGRGLGRHFAAPLRAIVQAAGRIAAGDYSARVPITREGIEIRELESSFNAMGAANEKTLNDLRLLTDDIAHDLRTPLTRLRAAAELALAEGVLKRPLAETVAEESSAMLEMINTMLDISRSEHRIDSTSRTEIDLGAFTRAFAELYAAVAEERGLTWSTATPDVPVPFMGHRGKLQRLFGNLLDNAVKFTPRGGTVSVTLRADPPAFVVSNTGPGIAPADIPCVFRRFWRADASRSLPGNGLGLALVKAIATSYGGTVDCTSVPGRETVFTVTLGTSDGR